MKLWHAITIICTIFILFFTYELVEDYVRSRDPKIQELRKKLLEIEPRAKGVKILEDKNYAYTINKEKVYIVLREKDGRYFDDNTLMHVLLHEVAHVLNKNIGHGPIFYEIFNRLKKRAMELGYYDNTQSLDTDYPIKE